MFEYFPRNTWSKKDVKNLVKDSQVYPTYSTINHLINCYSNDIKTTIDTGESILQRLPSELSIIWEDNGLALDYTYNPDIASKQLNMALQYIEDFDPTSLFNSVKILVKSIHLLETKDIYTDISYTDPDLPFTIFINLPLYEHENWLERIVENVIHETMHLQLSLIEKKHKLYLNNCHKTYSPWKDELRDSKGLLHALYVFANLQFFWQRVYNKKKCMFAAARIKDIETKKRLINYKLIEPLYTQKGVKLLRSCLILE